ncbi:Colicin I receptor [Fibrisoma limi BUZ 3]|uniref:Colicin I receptor n=1 Tax=Fibrisoma limi BUZ 3 TaxID=1185876 RepID=I2GMJ4_9BACT|nr:TonB-dependent receptor [Fibrisoma limi]CCH55122.1 Colicin I receptor [Fibrisoma limi BUZ 3]
MKNVCLFLLLSLSNITFGQDSLRLSVRSRLAQQVIPGAAVLLLGTSNGAVTDASGNATLRNVPTGPQRIRISAVGFETVTQTVTVPTTDTLRIALTPSDEELEEVIVTSTRTGRTVADEPTRVEIIDGEELDEKANMQPGNISVILRESTGIQVQQTSVTSANATLRIQGLDGRYTQLLQDGFPLYSGFASGLSLMQIPPLNLQQVEVIKGCQSTLYGSGAIAGLVNLITKSPTAERELSFLVNGTSALGLDLNGYYAQRYGKLGVTLYATHNRQRAYDPNKDQFSDIPDIRRTTLQPKLFWYPNETTTLSAGLIYSNEDRIGGYLPVLHEQRQDGYTEENDSRRVATQFRLDKRLANSAALTVKNSFSRFRRSITLPAQTNAYRFDGNQLSTFTEVSYFKHRQKSDWIFGANLWTDEFRNESPVNGSIVDPLVYRQGITGLFIQNTLTLSPALSLESGLRGDLVTTRPSNTSDREAPEFFLLPRFSLLYRASAQWTSRLGGGLGYKAPTLFTEEAERQSFRNIRLTSVRDVQSEESAGLNWDINYRTELTDDLTLSVNQLFFYTRLNRPVILDYIGFSLAQQLVNARGHIDTRGFETNVRVVYKDIHAFLGYSFIDTKRHFNGLSDALPLTAKHRLYMTTLYETERLKTGFEAFYTGRQQRSNGGLTRPYWSLGYMIERKWKWGSIFVNFENFLDVRQSRFETLVTGTPQQPTFVSDIYAPTDGRIINGGFKLKL